MEGTQLSLFGKTFMEPSHQTKEKTSDASLKSLEKSPGKVYAFLDLRAGAGLMPERSWQTDTASRGACLTLNTGECPSVAVESTLSQILEDNVPEKYYLSETACQGIIRRAEKRGKKLPKMLEEALREVAGM